VALSGAMNIATDNDVPHFENFTSCDSTGVIFFHVGDFDCSDLGGKNGPIYTSTVLGYFNCKIVLTGKNGCEFPVTVNVVAPSHTRRLLQSNTGCTTGATVGQSGASYNVCSTKSSASTLRLSVLFIAAILLLNIWLQ